MVTNHDDASITSRCGLSTRVQDGSTFKSSHGHRLLYQDGQATFDQGLSHTGMRRRWGGEYDGICGDIASFQGRQEGINTIGMVAIVVDGQILGGSVWVAFDP
jgi:hypothetical protein